ncbi:MAG: aminoacyl-histidine dipeptidase [Rikenellaceae bacterium]
MKITELQPKSLWENFANLCAIPHPSKHEDAIIGHIIEFANKHSLEHRRDLTGNLVVCKPATEGKENSPIVVLQAHVDMVPQKNSDKEFDFTKDPIEAIIEGDFVTANGTTLGADNGIGVAAMMAILESKELSHPPLECLFTIDEESGLTGANGLSSDIIKGKLLINLDSEDEGELYVGCAGAVNNTVRMEYRQKSTPSDHEAFELHLKGLKGGHSGIQIILQRANANKMLNRFIREQAAALDLKLSSFDGGNLRNAIPREAVAVVVVPKENREKLIEAAAIFQAKMAHENAAQEDGITLEVNPTAKPAKIIAPKIQAKIIAAITATPNGIIRMSDAMPGMVETSTNMARVGIADGKLEILFMSRCMVNYGKIELNAMIRSVWELAKAEVEEVGDYDGWAPNPQSVLLKVMGETYQEMFGVTPEVKAIHAGLECGIIGAKYEGMDMISVGPTIRYPHSPDENVDIASVEKFYNFLSYSLSKL